MHLIPFLLPLVVAASSVPYQEYILAPTSRDLTPSSVHSVNGSITNAAALTQASTGGTTFNGVSSVTYDFGKNVAGLVSLDVGSSSSPSAFLGVTFTESSIWISNEACDATGNSGLDTPLWFKVGEGDGTYTPDSKYMRGAFRYLTVVSNTTATVLLTGLHVNFTAAQFRIFRPTPVGSTRTMSSSTRSGILEHIPISCALFHLVTEMPLPPKRTTLYGLRQMTGTTTIPLPTEAVPSLMVLSAIGLSGLETWQSLLRALLSVPVICTVSRWA